MVINQQEALDVIEMKRCLNEGGGGVVCTIWRGNKGIVCPLLSSKEAITTQPELNSLEKR